MENASAYHFAYFEPLSPLSHDHHAPLIFIDDSFWVFILNGALGERLYSAGLKIQRDVADDG